MNISVISRLPRLQKHPVRQNWRIVISYLIRQIFMKRATLFERVGGKDTLEKVHQSFYDKVYAHPWLGKFFSQVDQKLIESQQTDFMSSVMGGPETYFGKRPEHAHNHMLISDELFELRSALLLEALKECGVPEAETNEWFRIDHAFKGRIVKDDVTECIPQYIGQIILNFEKP